MIRTSRRLNPFLSFGVADRDVDHFALCISVVQVVHGDRGHEQLHAVIRYANLAHKLELSLLRFLNHPAFEGWGYASEWTQADWFAVQGYAHAYLAKVPP